MKALEPVWIALCTYSVLPVPVLDWNEDNMRYSICWFPLVGVAVALLSWLWLWLAGALDVSASFFAAIAVVIPILITGGIHMDGFMDTVDAISSHKSREQKLEILKDSHCGAFAVIYCGVYFLLSYGVTREVYFRGAFAAIPVGYVISRGLSGFCALTLKNARGSGMLAAFTQPVQGKIARIVLGFTSAAAMLLEILLFRLTGACVVLSAVGTVLWYRKKTLREFGGVTGDTSGFFLQMCELMMLFGAWIGSFL